MKIKSLLLSLILLCCSCNKTNENLTILTPTGAPALAFYNYLESDSFQSNSTPLNIVSSMTENGSDIVVIDTIKGVQTINSGAPYKLAATITFGNFYIASTGNDEDNIMDKDDTIILFGQNQTPDLLFHKIYGEGYNIEYVTNVQDAAKCLVTGTNMISKSVVDYVFIAQPALYTVLNNANAATFGKASIYANVQEEYKKITDKDLVQASIFVNNNSDSKVIKSFLKDLENDINSLLDEPSLLSEKIDYNNQELTTKYGVQFAACEKLLKENNSIGLGYKVAIENKNNIDAFISLFNMETTDEEIYFK